MKAEKQNLRSLCYPGMYRAGNVMKTCLVTLNRANAEQFGISRWMKRMIN